METTLLPSVVWTVSSFARELKKPRQRCAEPLVIPPPASTSVRWRARPLMPLANMPSATMTANVAAA